MQIPPTLDTALATMNLIRKEIFCVDNTGVEDHDKPFLFSTPSIGLYAHAWNWDSAFHILGNAYLDPDFSLAELNSLLDRQLENGMIGHILYGKDEHSVYFPPVRFWNTANGVSDITQSPVLTAMLEQATRVVRRLHPRQYPSYESALRKALPALEEFHIFFRTHRDPLDIGSTSVAHPWENGTDNAPANLVHMRTIAVSDADRRWAQEKEAISNSDIGARERPPTAYYAKVHAVTKNVFADQDGDVDAVDNNAIGSFCLYDPLVHSLLLYSELALYRLAQQLALVDITERTRQRISVLTAGLELLWNAPKNRYDYIEATTVLAAAQCTPAGFRALSASRKRDFLEKGRLDVDTIACYLPLILAEYTPEADVLDAGISSERQSALLQGLSDGGYCDEHLFALPSASPRYSNEFYKKTYAVEDAGYHPLQYHRGPAWAHTNHLIQKALLKDPKAEPTFSQYATRIRKNLRDTIETSGMWEYFNPEDKAGLGTRFFGFTAALYIDLLFEEIASDLTNTTMIQEYIAAKQNKTKTIRSILQKKGLLQSLENHDAKLIAFGLQGTKIVIALNPSVLDDSNPSAFDAHTAISAALNIPKSLLCDLQIEERRFHKVYIVSLAYTKAFETAFLA